MKDSRLFLLQSLLDAKVTKSLSQGECHTYIGELLFAGLLRPNQKRIVCTFSFRDKRPNFRSKVSAV